MRYVCTSHVVNVHENIFKNYFTNTLQWCSHEYFRPQKFLVLRYAQECIRTGSYSKSVQLQ